MSFLADFEPALINSPYDRSQKRSTTTSKGLSSSSSSSSSSSPSSSSPFKSLKTKSTITSQSNKNIEERWQKSIFNGSSSSFSLLSSARPTSYDKKYWTDKLVTFILMMPY
ncbi:hypothetical protein Glove_14g55 [Diversispora epigaea]|uniref:Uncharacterized protein n=1 Tax=Diversispora epigaea TaxID=1348612 RepID=A0A397JRF8_9GLOM|nr:hypothetical protein Glove_14g55 [Diversispora epigaea]